MYGNALGATPRLKFPPEMIECIRAGGRYDSATKRCMAPGSALTSEGGDSMTYVWIGLGAVAVGGAAYYFFFRK